MPKHEIIACPRCRSHFECKVGTVLQCHCSQVSLSEAERNYIREQYTGCLCTSCMEALREEFWRRRIDRILARFSGHKKRKN